MEMGTRKEIVLMVEMRIRGTENEIRRERAKIAALSADEEVTSMYLREIRKEEEK